MQQLLFTTCQCQMDLHLANNVCSVLCVLRLQVSAQTMETNVKGVARVTRTFAPHAHAPQPPHGGPPLVLNVSSLAALWAALSLSTHVHRRVFDPTLTVDAVLALADEYTVVCSNGSAAVEAAGWSPHIYSTSKLLVNTLTTALARQYPTIAVTAVHPGLCNTDMIPASWKTVQTFATAAQCAATLMETLSVSLSQSGVFLCNDSVYM
eukprot:TRINITY_DN18594_c0_g1_i1.p1 TRINITY_DN18594_c0_g1~~TRINITY_DN18594_c0_g1_i1.p1  ORF type:complete len:208 (-),score=44.24 TRINITY_DN18594_c0_g1_i1:375-998(-)